MEKLPAFIRAKIESFKPEYQDLKFDSSVIYFEWLKQTAETEIFFKDFGQDLIKFHVAKSGEIINTETPSLGNIYNGALLLDDPELIIPGDNIRLWIPQFNEASLIAYPVVKVISKPNKE